MTHSRIRSLDFPIVSDGELLLAQRATMWREFLRSQEPRDEQATT